MIKLSIDGVAANYDELSSVPPANVQRYVEPSSIGSIYRFKSATCRHGTASEGSLPELEFQTNDVQPAHYSRLSMLTLLLCRTLTLYV